MLRNLRSGRTGELAAIALVQNIFTEMNLIVIGQLLRIGATELARVTLEAVHFYIVFQKFRQNIRIFFVRFLYLTLFSIQFTLRPEMTLDVSF